MNHPRYSVLNLFDPLTTPTTPTKDAESDREVSTPDSISGSDKENAVPHYDTYSNCKPHEDSDKLTMTVFFNRTYKTQPAYIPPVPLRKRLIDVGDATVTMDDASEMLSALAISEDTTAADATSGPSPGGDTSFEDHLATPVGHRLAPEPLWTPRPPPSAKLCRAPLVDIPVDATPVPRKAGANIAGATACDVRSPPSTVVRAPRLPPSASLIQSPLSSCATTSNLAPERDEEGSTVTPESGNVVIVVSEPTEADDTVKLSTAYPLLTETPLSESALPPSPSSLDKELPQDITENPAFLSAAPRPRPRSKTLSSSGEGEPSQDPNRLSVDLHSSFNWQLQCPEASFDLLNDRISFFGGDSFVLGADFDEFDAHAREEMMEALLRRKREKATNMQTPEDGSGGVKLDLKPADYEPESPIVTSAERMEKVDSPSSSPRESVPAVVPELVRGSKQLVDDISSPSIPPIFKSRRPSLVPTAHAQQQDTSGKEQVPQHLPPENPAENATKARIPPPQTQGEVLALPQTSKTPAKSSYKFVVPAPVHALRIVKRSHAQSQSHDRPTSIASEPSSNSNVVSKVAETCQSLDVLESQPSAASRPQTLHRPVLKGVLRPPPGQVAVPMLPTTTKPVAIVKNSSEDGSKISMKSKLTGVLGLRGKAPELARPADAEVIPNLPSVTTGVKSRLQKPVAGSNGLSSLPSKVPSNSQAKVSASGANVISHPKALRPQSRFATVSSGNAPGAASSLPRSSAMPSSKLPAPSFGTQRSKLPIPGATTIGRSGTIRR